MASKKKTQKDVMVSLHLLDDEPDVKGFIPTGSYALNKVISDDYNGGVPMGAITEFYGEHSTAKTVFLTSICIQAQKLGYIVKFIDVENSLSKAFVRSQGLDPKKLYYSNPESIEEIFEEIEAFILAMREQNKDTPIVIAVDSLAVAPVRKELEEDDYGQAETLGMIRAKIIGGCLRRVNTLLKKHNVALLVINQVRNKMTMFGSPETKASGGKSLNYYLAVSLKTKSSQSTGKIEDDLGNVIGITGVVENTKNKVGIPFRECEFEVVFDKGLSPEYGLVDMLCKDGIIDDKTSQGWCIVGEKKFRRKEFRDMFVAGEFPEITKILNLA